MSDLITDNLPLIAIAPDGIKRLRGLILELAVRGKLVPQDPNDEPASELVKRIARERAGLEAEGICKKSKPLPPVGEDEQPFALPSSWAWTRLGEITNFGQTDKHGEVRDTTWVLDLEDIEKDTSVLLRKVRFAERQAKSDKNRFQEGDVLYGKLRPYLNKVIVVDEEGVCTTEILPVRGYYGLFPRYLMHAVKRPDFLAYVNSKSYGMKMPRLGTEDGRLALFPLPPEQEQHRIVARVDELMALCDRLEAEQTDAAEAHARLVDALLATLTTSRDPAECDANWQRLSEHFDTLFTTEASIAALKQTVLQLAVMGRLVPQDPSDEPASELLKRIEAEKARLVKEGKIRKPKVVEEVGEDKRPFDVPVGWEWVRVTQLGSVGTGATPARTNPAFFNPPEIPWLTSGETDKPFIYSTRQHVSPIALQHSNLTIFPVGSLVVAMYGQGKTRGQVTELLIPATTNQACAALVFPLQTTVLRKYVKLHFQKIYDEIRELAEGGAQPNLNVGKIAATLVPLPPLPEQHRIVAKVDELMTLCDRLKADLLEARRHETRIADVLTTIG